MHKCMSFSFMNIYLLKLSCFVYSRIVIYFNTIIKLSTKKKHFVYIIHVCPVYIYYVCINTHTCMYLIKICYVYLLNIFMYNINYMHVNIYM